MKSFQSLPSLKGEDDPTAKEPFMEKQPGATQAVGVTAQLLVAIVVVVVGSSIPSGFCIGVLNTPHEVIRGWMLPTVQGTYGLELTNIQEVALWSTIVSIFVAGAIFGSSVGASLADRMGRRRVLFLNHCLGLASAVFFLSCQPAKSVELLILGRTLSGVSAGLATSIVPLYLSEIAPTFLAGVMGVLMPLGMTFGVLLAQILGMHITMGTDTLWPYLLAISGALATVGLVFHVFLPESPAYLYLILYDDVKGHKELCHLRGASHPDQVAQEERMLKAEAKKTQERNEEGWTLLRIMRTPKLRMPLLVSVILPIGQQFSGINAVFYYSAIVFINAGLDVHQSQMMVISTGVINFGLALVSVFLIKVCRRRVLFLTSVALSILCQVVLVVALRMIPYLAWAGATGMLAMMAFVLAYGIGLGPVPYMVGTEVFPPGPRSVGLAMGGMANWLGNLTVGFTFPLIENSLGKFSFCFFIGCSLLLWLFAYLFLPETLQRKTERHSTTEPDLPNV